MPTENLEKRIAIVSSSEGVRDSLEKTLSGEDYVVSSFPATADALQEITINPVDVLIIDVNLPGDGCQGLTLQIRSEFPGTAILILTDYESISKAREIVRGGAKDYIFTPIDEGEVLRLVGRHIEKRRMVKENKRLKETISLFSMSDLVNLPKDGPSSLYRAIVDSSLGQTGSTLGGFVLFDEDKRRLEIHYVSCITAGHMQFPHDYMSFEAVEYVLEHCEPVLLTNERRHALTGELMIFELSTEVFPEILPMEKEVLLYPLKSPRSRTAGFIVISKKKTEHSFSIHDLQVLGIIASQSSVSVHNAYLVEGLERNYVNTLMSLNAILEAKHPYTRGHTQRVTRFSTTIARELGLSSDEIKVMRDGALLHDIGKIGISDAILNKPCSLDEQEFDIIREHPIIGETIIRPIKFLEPTLPIIRHHHERMDGRGWPDGLVGVQIPLLVRICTLTDAYDAMASQRPYRETMSEGEIRRELIRHCGTQFDEELVEVFLRLLDRGSISQTESEEEPMLLRL